MRSTIPLRIALLGGTLLAQSPAAEELKKLEHDWVGAQKAKDPARLGEILADNWVGVDWDGTTSDRAAALAHLKMPGYGIESIEMGPLNVRFFGNVAVVTGTDTEKSRQDGKDSSGKYAFTDVFVKQKGKWKAVASQNAKLP
jgi:ketosteroid isomerase-like protein